MSRRVCVRLLLSDSTVAAVLVDRPLAPEVRAGMIRLLEAARRRVSPATAPAPAVTR